MSTGRRSSGKRPRNDLDDYLDEVKSYLFCVTRADKECLLRDLKAHVRELTTDPISAHRFEGKYLITREQLVEEIGEPQDVTSMYISSVSRRVPSLGLVLFIFLMSTVFFIDFMVGIDRISIGFDIGIEMESWFTWTGLGLVLVGASVLALIVFVFTNFQRYHSIIIYTLILFIVLSIPVALYISNGIIRTLRKDTAAQFREILFILFVLDFIIVSIIGLYIYLDHYRALTPRKEYPI